MKCTIELVDEATDDWDKALKYESRINPYIDPASSLCTKIVSLMHRYKYIKIGTDYTPFSFSFAGWHSDPELIPFQETKPDIQGGIICHSRSEQELLKPSHTSGKKHTGWGIHT